MESEISSLKADQHKRRKKLNIQISSQLLSRQMVMVVTYFIRVLKEHTSNVFFCNSRTEKSLRSSIMKDQINEEVDKVK